MNDKRKPLSTADVGKLLEEQQQTDRAAYEALESSIDFSRPLNLSDPDARQMIEGLLRAEDDLEDGGKARRREPIVLPAKRVTDNLERDGANLIRGALVLMSSLKYPPDVRDYCLTLMGLSDGKHDEEITITEDVLQLHLGWSKGVLKRKRDRLKEHETKQGFSLVLVKEGAMDRGTGRWKPTEYRMALVKYSAALVRRTRSMRFWHAKGKEELMLRAAEDQIDRIAREVVSDAPHVLNVSRPKKKKEDHHVTLLDQMESETDRLRQRIVMNLEDLIENQIQQGKSLADAMAELQSLLNPIVEKYHRAFVAGEKVSDVRIALRVERASEKRKRGNGASLHP